jgi:hypothetical protein
MLVALGFHHEEVDDVLLDTWWFQSRYFQKIWILLSVPLRYLCSDDLPQARSFNTNP